MTYAFLLRMPSEAIPARARVGERCLRLERGSLVLHLSRRKNKPEGSRLVRGCWCKESKTTCPLHVLGPWLEDCTDGSPLFPSVTAAGALRVLRTMLADLAFPHAAEYRTHDFRRGHAKDLQVSGRRLCCFFRFSVDHHDKKNKTHLPTFTITRLYRRLFKCSNLPCKRKILS